MQEPFDNLSANARTVYNFLAEHSERNWHAEDIAETHDGDLSAGEVADALHELAAAKRAVEVGHGWSVLE